MTFAAGAGLAGAGTPFSAVSVQVVARSRLQLDWGLLAEAPAGTGDERWDVFAAPVAEHVAGQDGCAGPSWAASRTLRRLVAERPPWVRASGVLAHAKIS